MAYDQELNELIDGTVIGKAIKKRFTTAQRGAENLKKEATDAIAPDGEFTAPLLIAFSEENQTKMKE